MNLKRRVLWNETVPPTGLDNVMQVSADLGFSMALRNNG